MIVELREYTVAIGRVADFVRLYEEKGLPVQVPVVGGFRGMFTTEFGAVNQVVTLWSYADELDRRRRRAALFQEPAWLAFLKEAAPLVVAEQSRLLNPTPASPLR
jgi:hypothetical protein